MTTCAVSGLLLEALVHLAAEHAGVREEEVLVEEHGEDVVDRARRRRASIGSQLVVPLRRPARPCAAAPSARSGRGSASPTATASPMLDPEEDDAEAGDQPRGRTRRGSCARICLELVDLDEPRRAMNSSTPASAARGMSCGVGGERATSTNAPTTATRPDHLGAPAGQARDRRARGTAFTGNAPTSPATMFATPTPTKSRPTLSATPNSSADVRAVAALWRNDHDDQRQRRS